MDIIHAQNEYALSSSVSQLKGSLEKKIRELRNEIINPFSDQLSVISSRKQFTNSIQQQI